MRWRNIGTPESITGIVMRPAHGRDSGAGIDAPSFDPNDLRTVNTNTEPDRVISDVMEPGSTFKTIVISGALNEHVVTLNDKVFCENGVFHYGGITLHDSEHNHLGETPIWQVLQKSSNIGASKVGIGAWEGQTLSIHDGLRARGVHGNPAAP